MKLPRSLNTRLVLSHLLVSLVSIILMVTFAGRSILQSARGEAERNLQVQAFAAANALELPIEEYRAGQIEASKIDDLLEQLFANNPDVSFTVYKVDGTPLVDSSGTLPPPATLINAPEVQAALRNAIGRGMDIRNNPRGDPALYLAVVIQREIEVTGILRLSRSIASTENAARSSLALLILTASLIAFGVSLVGWLLASNLARPILVLTQAAERMGRGDLGVRVVPSGPQEMYHLAEAFNKMANRLQTNVNELRAFVANASHELRTPLTVVKLRAEALQNGAMEDSEVASKFMGEIETEIDRLVRMVNDLLDLSRVEAELEPEQRRLLNLNTVASEVYQTFKMRAERGQIELTMNVEPGLPSVMGNEDQLRRVFYNLLDNAIKYTPSGGKVEFSLRPGAANKTVRIQVCDNGMGIAPEHLSHVFERFYRAETLARTDVERGSGLGLAIAKSIIESHGGKIGVSSQVGEGTTFWA